MLRDETGRDFILLRDGTGRDEVITGRDGTGKSVPLTSLIPNTIKSIIRPNHRRRVVKKSGDAKVF